jgi:Capsular polysaccharide synthesis protein/Tetratricopeptide repeat
MRARRLERAGDWAGVASALEPAVARDPSDVGLRHRLGRAYRRLGRANESERRLEEAEAAYRAALEQDPAPETAKRLARVLNKQRRRGEAVGAQRIAAEGLGRALVGADSNEARQRLGQALERSGDIEGARRVYLELIERDPEATDLDRRLLDAAVRRFPARRRQARFVTEHLDEIRGRAAGAARSPSGLPARVWVYWGQGFAEAPPVVSRCQEELRRYHTADEVVALDDRRVTDYVEIPELVRRRTARNRTKFSDVLRLELLSRHGGIWLDATCLVRGRVPDVVPELLDSGFFAFRHRPARIASWFLASEPNHPVVAMTREAQYLYWEHFPRATEYFILHHLIESLYYVADEFREHFESTPRRGVRKAVRFRHAMDKAYDPQRYEKMLAASFVHKLTHKLPPGRPRQGSMLAHFMEEGPWA